MSIFATAAATAAIEVASVTSASIPTSSSIDVLSSNEPSTPFVLAVYFVLAALLFAALGLVIVRGIFSSPLSDAPPEYEEVPSCEVDIERTAELDKENGEIILVTKKTKSMGIRQYLAEQGMMQALADAGFV